MSKNENKSTSSTPRTKAAFWFRRDLRLHDNTGLFHALKSGHEIIPIFIFDPYILEKLEKSDARVTFIYESLLEIQKKLKTEFNKELFIYHDKPAVLWPKLIKKHNLKALYFNHDYEPSTIKRDLEVSNLAKKIECETFSFKDQVHFEKGDILKKDNTPYTVFTPYKNKWLAKLQTQPIEKHSSEKHLQNLTDLKSPICPSLTKLGFEKSKIQFPSTKITAGSLKNYDKQRDFPAHPKGTSLLGLHLRFGTISPRNALKNGLKINAIWLSELIWREFFMQILYHFPESEHNCFKAKYEKVPWSKNENSSDFEAWKNGKTGVPLVDAGMRELNQTGHMHNRVRMLVASYLTKHLMIHWKLGERYFASKLLDYELSSNVGNWQWAAGCGCDAAPYFRVFSPEAQQKKFDSKFEYISKWVPEYDSPSYPEPVVDHSVGRNRALSLYKEALQ